MDGDEALAVLVGGHLDTVSFVMDYVEFRIGYNCFRALRSAHVELHDGTIVDFPDPGSRDALCRLIDTEMVSAAEVEVGGEARRIEIKNDRGDVLSVDLSGFDEIEFAHLVPADSRGGLDIARMFIW